jgi:hypothetical protein
MTRRSSTSLRPTRQRRTGSTPRRVARQPVAGIRNLGFTCFSLVAVHDPEIAFAFRRVHETRNAMGAFASR